MTNSNSVYMQSCPRKIIPHNIVFNQEINPDIT